MVHIPAATVSQYTAKRSALWWFIVTMLLFAPNLSLPRKCMCR
jgi:hypothetical protein